MTGDFYAEMKEQAGPRAASSSVEESHEAARSGLKTTLTSLEDSITAAVHAVLGGNVSRDQALVDAGLDSLGLSDLFSTGFFGNARVFKRLTYMSNS